MKTVLYTMIALLAFAGNSVLCRLALGGDLIDAAGFTVLRLLSGAFTLAVLCLISVQQKTTIRSIFKPTLRHLKSSVLLFTYAITFSYAYLILETGTGALILFGAVQLTMLLGSILLGKRPSFVEWLGVVLAFVGLTYLLIPSWGTPSLLGFLLMTLSGLSWGLYTLAGKGSEDALLDTSRNFILTLPLVAVLALLVFQPGVWWAKGVILAVLSGAITSGIGYAVWYAVLPKLKETQAGVIQLLVPVLAAVGGMLFAAEKVDLRFAVSSGLVLGGIFLVMMSKNSARKHNQPK